MKYLESAADNAPLWRHPEFAQGFRNMVGPSLGIAAWGLMTGVAARGYGFSPLEAILLCNLVFAGSAQMAAMPLMLAGAPLWVIWATGFCVNLRFLVFSAHLRHYFLHLPLAQRWFTGFFCADLNYAMLVQRYPEPPKTDEQRRASMAYVYGAMLINVASWMLPSAAGALLAGFIPAQWGLGFAGILALVGILTSMVTTRLRAVAAGVAAVVALLAVALPLKLNILTAILAATMVCVWLQQHPVAPTQGGGDGD
jgi:predicted branched-subunit amino acid permease